jgi:hypothetical protein
MYSGRQVYVSQDNPGLHKRGFHQTTTIGLRRLELRFGLCARGRGAAVSWSGKGLNAGGMEGWGGGEWQERCRGRRRLALMRKSKLFPGECNYFDSGVMECCVCIFDGSSGPLAAGGEQELARPERQCNVAVF